LDDVLGDEPKGCWSLQVNDTGKCAIIRHSMWSGYTAFHHKNSNSHGSCYVGDGLKNDSLCFMI